MTRPWTDAEVAGTRALADACGDNVTDFEDYLEDVRLVLDAANAVVPPQCSQCGHATTDHLLMQVGSRLFTDRASDVDGRQCTCTSSVAAQVRGAGAGEEQ